MVAACWSCRCTCACPACSAVVRTVVALTCIPVKNSSSRQACRKGIHVASRTFPSCIRGVKVSLGRNSSSSSRGKKAHPAGGTIAVAAFYLDLLIALRGHMSHMLASFLQLSPTGSTAPFLLQLSSLRLSPLHHIFQHPGSHSGHVFLDGFFDLRKRRSGMLHSPVFHATQDFLCQFLPLRFSFWLHELGPPLALLRLFLLPILPPSPLPLQKSRAHPLVQGLCVLNKREIRRGEQLEDDRSCSACEQRW